MKAIKLGFLAFAAFFLTACNEKHDKCVTEKNELSENLSTSQTQVVAYKDTVAKLRKQLAELPEKLRKEQERIQDSIKFSPENLGATKLDLSTLSVNAAKDLDGTYAQYFVNTDFFENIPDYLATFLGKEHEQDSLRIQLENPVTLKKLFTTIKPVLPTVIEMSGSKAQIQRYARLTLPYFTWTATQKIREFDKFNENRDTTLTLSALEEDTTWTNMVSKLNMSSQDVDQEFRAYLFAIRRHHNADAVKKGQGQQLSTVVIEILNYLLSL